MTARKGDATQWRHTSVLIRDDIFSLAQKQGLNLSHECNQALADRLGVDYRQQQLPSETRADPVIIAAEQKPGPASRFSPQKDQIIPPVLNADDPKTPARVLLQKKEPAARIPHPKREIAPVQKQDKPQDSPVPSTHPEASARLPKKKGAKSTEIKGKENAVRRFVNEKVLRTDAEGNEGSAVPKDEMYQRFMRWCRAHSVSPIPDKRSFGIAMKNRFVIQDGTANNEPCWINVKLI
ncbi:MAG: hypothetical protein OS112_09235 [Methanoregula sp.]|nr:MAG: hypothetical protein OS112_09235 [Methanoregula sp.]